MRPSSRQWKTLMNILRRPKSNSRLVFLAVVSRNLARCVWYFSRSFSRTFFSQTQNNSVLFFHQTYWNDKNYTTCFTCVNVNVLSEWPDIMSALARYILSVCTYSHFCFGFFFSLSSAMRHIYRFRWVKNYFVQASFATVLSHDNDGHALSLRILPQDAAAETLPNSEVPAYELFCVRVTKITSSYQIQSYIA